MIKRFLNYYLPMFLSIVLVVTAAFSYSLLKAPKAQAAIVCSTATNASQDSGTVTTTTLAYLGAVSAGDILLVGVRVGAIGRSVRVTDNLNTGDYSQDATQAQTTDGHQLYIFSFLNSKAGTPTVTVTMSGAAVSLRVMVNSCSGVATSFALDVTKGGQGDAGTAATTGATATRDTANELLYVTSGNNCCATSTAGSNFTVWNQVPAGTNARFADERQIVSATGTDAGAITWGSSVNWSIVMATYRIAPASVTTYNYSRAITVDHTKVGTVNNTDQTNFTMLVCANGTSPCNASVSGLNQTGGGAHVQNSSGYDIIFATDSACTNLMHWEMENYVASTGEIEAWVKINSLSHTGDNVFYMCYGSSIPSKFQGGGANNTWDTNYVGVWHFPNGSSLSYTDSKTVNTPVDTNHALTATSSPIGGGFWQPFGKYASTTNPTGLPSGTATKTLETIVKFTGATTTGFIVAGFGNNKVAGAAYEQYYNGSRMGVNDQGASTGFTKVLDSSWHYYASTATSSAISDIILYWDGAKQTPIITGSTALNTGTLSLLMGAATDASSPFIGYMDEMRISNTNRLADWIATEYNNDSNPNNGAGQFYSVGGEVAFIRTVEINIQNASINIKMGSVKFQER